MIVSVLIIFQNHAKADDLQKFSCHSIAGSWDQFGWPTSISQGSDGTLNITIYANVFTLSGSGSYDTETGGYNFTAVTQEPHQKYDAYGNLIATFNTSSIDFSGHLDSGCHYMTGNPTIFHDYDGTTEQYDHDAASDDFQKDCDVPTTEVSSFENVWFATGTFAWKGTLSPIDLDFGGRAVQESGQWPPLEGDGQYDSCYWSGSKYPKLGLTGGTWQVGKEGFSGNDYGDDGIGWWGEAIDYYRANRSDALPCGFRLIQRMSINCSSSGDWRKYKEHMIGGDIFSDHVTSIRDGNTASKEE